MIMQFKKTEKWRVAGKETVLAEKVSVHFGR